MAVTAKNDLWICGKFRHDDDRPMTNLPAASDADDLQARVAELTAQNQRLQLVLQGMSQGIIVVDEHDHVAFHNQQACKLLDLPEAFMASRPHRQELLQMLIQRGDYGPQGSLVESAARSYVLSQGAIAPPARYLRKTLAGRTLEVQTMSLSMGGLVRTFSDVTEFVQAQASAARLNMVLEATQSLAQVGGWEVDVVNRKVFWTREVYEILETSPEEYAPTIETTSKFFAPQSRVLIQAAIDTAVSQGIVHDLELEMITAKGNPIWVHSKGMVTTEGGRVIRRTSVLQNITQRRLAEHRLQESEQRWKLALDSAGDGVWDWNLQTGVELFSKRFVEMYGFKEGELENLSAEFDRRTHPDDLAQLARDRQAHLDGKTPTYVNEHRVQCKDGSWKWVLTRGMLISRDEQGRPLRMIGTHTDITSRKASEAMVWQQANFDSLTGLPNRRMLRDRLLQDIRKCRRESLQLAILFIDLDHFKEVNDTLGHDKGDQLLVQAAQRIQACVRQTDTVARMGGDEFTVVLSELTDAGRMERTLQAILDGMAAMFQLGSEQVFVSASIGITVCPGDGDEVEVLFKNADQALYVAKGAGRNRFSFFTSALQEAAQNRVRLANDLRAGLTGQQFHVEYQPIVHLASGAVHKAEALLRWNHPVRGAVSPAEFIPIAETSGLIIEMGDWVFHEVVRQALAWRQALHPQFQVSVNKSPIQFHHEGNDNQQWVNYLREQNVPGDAIVVEITEGLLLDASSHVTSQLMSLRDAGLKVSLDDFGTGYSSLSYLQKFEIDFIKIDQSFVRHLVPNSTDLALCKAIISMAHALGMQVVAEGIETESQRDLLLAAGCDFGQGYWLARPMRPAALAQFVAERARWAVALPQFEI
jgi:diguanylate cyclase (GGDEF)-like protein/PAS domain S-box-containing protein